MTIFKGSLDTWFQRSTAVQLSTFFGDIARRRLVVTTSTTNVCRATSQERTRPAHHLHNNDCVPCM